jgi:serine/threonine protein phosphatase PrpC
MKYGFSSEVGRVRKINEDAYYVPGRDQDLLLFMVADGMGGHQAGDIASKEALKAMVEFFNKQPDDSYKQNMPKALSDAISYTNDKVFNIANKTSEYAGMGTTMSVVVITGSKMYTAHIGDSRVYIYREAKLLRLTEDHSIVAELIKNGELTEEQAKTHPQRNIITRAVGTDYNVSADIAEWDLYPGDVILLCTDGLTGLVSDEEILKYVSNYMESPQTVSEKLAQLANERGGYDNITVVVVNTSDDTGEGNR